MLGEEIEHSRLVWESDDAGTSLVMALSSTGCPVIWLFTFITSIPALFLCGPVLNNPDFIVSAGADTSVRWGAFLEMFLALAGIGSAVALYPITKRQNEAVALGYVAIRIFESAVIAVGIISLLAVLALRQDLGGSGAADAASLGLVGQGLVAIHDAAS